VVLGLVVVAWYTALVETSSNRTVGTYLVDSELVSCRESEVILWK
jgi:hypothetical protein